MEKLILTCGRFEPQRGGSMEARLEAAETCLARLTAELEFLLSELGRSVGTDSVSGNTVSVSEGEVV